MKRIEETPCADKGLTSYRYRSHYGWIMIGAKDLRDALSEASRSTEAPATPDRLEVWSEETESYVKVNPPMMTHNLQPRLGDIVAHEGYDAPTAIPAFRSLRGIVFYVEPTLSRCKVRWFTSPNDVDVFPRSFDTLIVIDQAPHESITRK